MKYHFPFYVAGQRDAPNQSEPHKPTLDLFRLNMTAIILQKIRSVSLLFGGDKGWRLFKDKCSGVHDPCGNHTTQNRAERRGNMSADAVWLHECTCVHMMPCVDGFVLTVWCRCSSASAQ